MASQDLENGRIPVSVPPSFTRSSFTATSDSMYEPSENEAQPAINHDKQEQIHENENPSEWKAGKEEWMVMVVLLITAFLVSVDATILVPVLPNLASTLHGSAIDAFWTATSYLLTNTIFQPTITALSDIFGRRALLFISVVFFTIGTIICCTANGFPQLLAGRSIKGVGGGGIIALSLVILADVFPLRQRPTFYSIMTASWAVGTLVGPVVGGLIVDNTTWRWLFYLNFPFCALALLTIPMFLKIESQPTAFHTKVSRIDWTGNFLFIGGLTPFLIAITWGGIMYAWDDWRTLLPLLLGVVVLVLTGVWEGKFAKYPFLRLLLFNNRSAILGYFLAVLQGLLMYAGVYYLPFFLASTHGFTSLQSGLAVLPMTGTMLPATIITGLIMSRTGAYVPLLWTGWALMALANGLLLLLDEHSPTGVWVAVFLVLGLGHGVVLPPMAYSVQAAAQPADVAYSAGMYAFLRTCGQCLGVATAGTLFQNLLRKGLERGELPAEIAHNAEGYVLVLNEMDGADVLRVRVVGEYATAFRGLFGFLLGLAVLGLVLSLGVKKLSLDQEQDTGHHLEEKGRK